MHRRHLFIYRSRLHILITVASLLLPFAFLFFFSHVSHVSSRELFTDMSESGLRLFIAYIIAVILAWLMAVLFYEGKRAIIALPVFDVLQSFPTFAALPLGTLYFGAGNFTVVFFLVITVIWPLFFTIISSLKLSKHEWREAVDVSRIRGWKYIKMYLLPVTIPGLITGSIIGLGEGWEALVATEIIVGTPRGIGQFFQTFSTNAPVTGFGIFGLLLVIFVINKLLWLPLLDWSHRTMDE
jgi:NitT/TauT family transport system permease protein